MTKHDINLYTQKIFYTLYKNYFIYIVQKKFTIYLTWEINTRTP